MDRKPEPEWMDDPEEARAYAEADFAEVNAAFVTRLLEVAPGPSAIRTLDLGCGPGDIALRVRQARPGWDVVGLDASAAMLRHARKNAGPDIAPHWVIADARGVPFPDHTFSLVFSNSILHHVAEPAELWSEVRRLAKPGTPIFFRDLMRPASEAEAHRLVQQYAGKESALLQEEFYRSFLAAYTVKEVWQQLVDSGLGTLRVAAATDRHLDIWGLAV
jgi:ubiquinone/menaquinone biosynthesis C-methylase UbiE